MQPEPDDDSRHGSGENDRRDDVKNEISAVVSPHRDHGLASQAASSRPRTIAAMTATSPASTTCSSHLPGFRGIGGGAGQVWTAGRWSGP